MKIQEMRSGFSHFVKKPETPRVSHTFEITTLLEAELMPELEQAALSIIQGSQFADGSENELDKPIWAVVSFERTEATGLKYKQASSWLAELDLQGVHGLCIITAEAAARIKS